MLVFGLLYAFQPPHLGPLQTGAGHCSFWLLHRVDICDGEHLHCTLMCAYRHPSPGRRQRAMLTKVACICSHSLRTGIGCSASFHRCISPSPSPRELACSCSGRPCCASAGHLSHRSLTSGVHPPRNPRPSHEVGPLVPLFPLGRTLRRLCLSVSRPRMQLTSCVGRRRRPADREFHE